VRRAALVAAALAVWGGTARAEPARAGPAGRVKRFAVVIGNNHSGRSDTRDLRYADDDAVAMHQLLAQAGVDSSLFVNLDAESRQLYPGLRSAGRPRWSALRARLDRIEAEIRAAGRAGVHTSLLVFFSGHGDVANGEGYVELEDAHLSRTLLRSGILDRTSASEVHVVVDACRSYYLAFEKGAGGHRRRAAAGPLVDRGRARIGYVLSTSSDRESHEWEAFQGGIFSHEVRSALRGAADVDRDGRVTYAELGAFLAVANRGIRNARFRPDFVVRPPAELTDELLGWSGAAQALLLDLPGQGHMVLEGPGGERVLDVHPLDGESLLVHLPGVRPLFLRRADGDREFTIPAQPGTATLRLSSLGAGPVRVASKGALHLAFSQLFSAPFGVLDVVRYREAIASAPEPEPDAAVSADADLGGGRATARRLTGATAIVAGVAGLGLAGWAIERSAEADRAEQSRRPDLNATVENARLAAGISLGVAASAAVVYWLLGDDDPDQAGLAVMAGPGAGGVYAITLSSFW